MHTTPVVDEQFAWEETEEGRVLVSRPLQRVARHVFTTRQLTFRGDHESRARARLAGLLGVAPDRLATVVQVHGAGVVVIDECGRRDASMAAGGRHGTECADAVVSADPAGAAGIRTADCVPILLADRRRRAVAAVHAGWRGTAVNVAGAAVRALAALGIAGGDLVAAIGPSIGPCCYQIDAPVRDALLAARAGAEEWFREDGAGRWRLDLWAANVGALVEAGLSREAISVARLCTAEHLDTCFSHRAEGPSAGRMMAAIRRG